MAWVAHAADIAVRALGSRRECECNLVPEDVPRARAWVQVQSPRAVPAAVCGGRLSRWDSWSHTNM